MAFSEIFYSYMPYSHLWASGTLPYLDQWYEYPPATIPLFYLPHLIDMGTRFKFIHLNYLEAYRGGLLIWDIGLFSLIWLTLKKVSTPQKILQISLLFYILMTVKAHDFIYDTMDLTFVTAMTFGIAVPVFLNSFLGSATSWFGFFLATALKYVNAPLVLIYAVIERKRMKETVIACFIGFLLVWALPLAFFRSSILVSLVYQNIRGIQIDSVPAIFLRTANVFTKSEQVIEVFKNYEIAGPLTNQVKNFVKIFFPLSVLCFLIGSSLYIIKNKKLDNHWSRVHFTLGYVLLFFLTGKVLSTPFLLWLIPLTAIYPFRKTNDQLAVLIPSAVAISISMTNVPNWSIFIFPFPLIVGWIRTFCFLFLFMFWLKLSKQEINLIRKQPK